MNKSFVYMQGVLEDLRVENNSFLFRLIDKDLLDVDPWDPEIELDDVIINSIITEIQKNVWYFLRSVVRVNDEPFGLNIGTVAQTYLYDHNVNSILMTCRQVGGKSTLLQALIYRDILLNCEIDKLVAHPMPNNIKVPSYIMDRLKSNPTGLPVHKFVDDLMFVNDQIVIPKDRVLVANSVIGTHHADVIAASIPFSIKIFDGDLSALDMLHSRYITRPLCFRIHEDPKFLNNGYVPEEEFVNNINCLVDSLKDNPRAIHREIVVKPGWSCTNFDE